MSEEWREKKRGGNRREGEGRRRRKGGVGREGEGSRSEKRGGEEREGKGRRDEEEGTGEGGRMEREKKIILSLIHVWCSLIPRLKLGMKIDMVLVQSCFLPPHLVVPWRPE